MIGDPSLEVLRARGELTRTLDLIEDKLNVPKRVRASIRRADEFRRRNPVAFVGAVASIAGAVAGVTWFAVAVLRRR